MFLRFLKQLRSIILLIALALGLPAFFLDVLTAWQLATLYIGYAIFLIGSVWNTISEGRVSQPRESQAVQRELGAITSLATAGLWLLHPLAVYDFAKWRSLAGLLPPLYLDGIAMSLLALAIVVVHHSTRTLGKFFDRLALKPDHQLITKGIYGAIRHPIYLSYLLLFSSCAILLHSLWSLLLLAIAGGIVFGNHIRVEEAMMEARFGAAFQAYKLKTKKLIPLIY
jgi:protein-S-isoprenylcysteine O-methyltransferase Ste14